MTANILLSAHEKHHQGWLGYLRRWISETGIAAVVDTGCDDPGSVDYIIHSPDGPIVDFTPYSNLRAVLGMWAGVEDIVNNPTLKVPLTRMVDPGMIEGMTEWITGQVLRHHLGFDQHILNDRGDWLKSASPPLARSRSVGILGLGVLGGAAASILAALNFQVYGWRNSQGGPDGIEVLRGPDGFRHILSIADILVLQLPLTPETTNILDRQAFQMMKTGMTVINSGRGGLIDDDALLEAIDCGIVSHATLDVFRQEPLPPDHPFWKYPKVSVWPHISSETRIETGSRELVRNIARDLDGQKMKNLVQIDRGY